MNSPTHSCPRCGSVVPTQSLLQARNANEVRGCCPTCKEWISFVLPLVHKKLIYLDQSLLSAASIAAENLKSSEELALVQKIRQLKAEQKIFVVISDIHSRETSATPNIENRKALWKFQNELADGNISSSWREVYVAQQRRALTGDKGSESFPAIDIGLKNPHQWKAGMSIQLTNSWRQRLDAASAPERSDLNEAYRQIIDRQMLALPKCKDARDCLTFIQGLWHRDIRDGVTAWLQRRNQMQFVQEELAQGRYPNFTSLADSPFRSFVGEVLNGLDEEPATTAWLQTLENVKPNFCASAAIRIAFEAGLLWQRKTGTPPTNLDTINEKLGLSRQNDIDHVSSFVPYVDALTTDNGMSDLCRLDIVADELKRFPCRIFSKKNYGDFEAWLDELLVARIACN